MGIKETNTMKYSNAFEQSITKEQKELLKTDVERTIEGAIKAYTKIVNENNNEVNRLVFHEYFNEFVVYDRLLGNIETSETELVYAMYDAVTEYLYTGEPLMKVKELKELS